MGLLNSNSRRFIAGACLPSPSLSPSLLGIACRVWLLVPCSLLVFGGLVGCDSGEGTQEVIVYTALDQEFSEPILNAFTEETGIRVRAKYDTESTKTVGLTNTLIAEANRPRCDVFWNNEILNTLRLERHDLLARYQPEHTNDFPAAFQDDGHRWHGFAARARIFIVNTKQLTPEQYPRSVQDLADETWKGKVGIAKPLFGTTATHAAILFSRDADKAKTFFKAVKQNAQVMSGNKQVALAVGRGQLAWGITDTDDAMVEVAKGMPVKIVYPDQPLETDDESDEALGTLFIPNTLAIIKNGPNPDCARALVDYLLDAKIELRLAEGPSAQIPLATSVDPKHESIRVKSPATAKAFEPDWNAAAESWDEASAFLREEFARGG